MLKRISSALILLWAASLVSAEPWDTYRANPQRTGCADGKSGPTAAPKVFWVMKSKEHFIASPVPYKDRLFASGLGFLNTSVFYSLDTSAKAEKRVAWSRSSPEIALPTVSSPAISDGKLV